MEDRGGLRETPETTKNNICDQINNKHEDRREIYRSRFDVVILEIF